MIILEKLYDLAEQHLDAKTQDWTGFSDGFTGIADADISLYRISFKEDNITPIGVDVIATSNKKFMKEYVNRQLYNLHPVKETDLQPLEPVKRTDYADDDQFMELGELADFLINNGVFYIMMVPAVLPDGSFLGLYMWRSKAEADFTNVELQRAVLFMRHLLAIIDVNALLPIKPELPAGNPRTASFGERFGLTNAEISVLSALLSGHSPRSIASKANRSYGTVRWHIQNILEKCQVSSQKELFRAFFELID